MEHDDTTSQLSDPQELRATGAVTRFPCLRVLSGPLSGRLYRLDKESLFIGRGGDNDVVVDDHRISRVHARLVRSEDGSVMLIDQGSTNGTLVGGAYVPSKTLVEGDQIALGGAIVFKFSYLDPMEEQVQEKLYQDATTDQLTGLLNRRALLERLKLAKSPAVALVDVDHFKKINDQHGHAAGDAVLVELTRRLAAALGPRDSVGRYGGEEFLVVMPDSTLQAAAERLEAARKRIEGEPFAVGRVTISCGVAVGEGDPETLIGKADVALYQAKEMGRNRVVLSDEALATQKRRTTRLQCWYPVHCELEGNRFAATVRDMGLWGMRLELPGLLKTGTALTVVLPGTSLAPVNVRVVWCRPSQGVVQAGVRYLDEPAALERSWVKETLKSIGFVVVPIQDRRQSVRCSLSMTARLLTSASEATYGRITNLGPGGAQVQCAEMLTPGQHVQLEMSLSSEHGTFLAGARVAYCQPYPESWLCGLCFEGLKPAEVQVLTSHVRSLLWEL